MLPFPTPGDFSDPRSKPSPFVSPAFAGGFFTTTPPEKPLKVLAFVFKSMVYFAFVSSFEISFDSHGVRLTDLKHPSSMNLLS